MLYITILANNKLLKKWAYVRNSCTYRGYH